VVAALDASAFDWSLIGRPVTVQISDCGCAGSRPGVVVLDETMLASSPYGRAYTWGRSSTRSRITCGGTRWTRGAESSSRLF
jgi:hypothetical protein